MSDTLSDLTTLRVGGPAGRLVPATTRELLVDTVREEWADGEHPLVLGGGSNTLAADDGFDGTVVQILTRGIERLESEPGRVRLRVEAGESWDGLVAYAVENGWSGVEALSGIPGSCGAAPIQNIGAYGQELESVLVSIDLLDRDLDELVTVPAADLGLGYRTSVLKRHGGSVPERDGVVVALELELSDDEGLSAPIAYPQLASALGVELGARLPIADVRATVLDLRASKGMVLDDADTDTWSAGSFFTNPIVSESFARSLPSDAPRWPLEDGQDGAVVIPLGEWDGSIPRPSLEHAARVKLSAAWLIERAGIRRGFRLPGSRAAISSKHTLALTNTGGATADEIAALARFVQARVASEFGVVLQPEPVFVGLSL
ncbi:UDP-N-acetylmuramate dehydrogenase [Mycetocola manganoxydans]|uniref:UDP-N-acetylenolpyruvoylglucosamine reductase n=1 Tax=Mycetocola manganoxydans TaxID=699879 RepID=A0A3L6ZJ58_9MICO|nr:UDP-N-acetylmuramate dehydrogenase [Mycetocola manganoxydans]RLP68044.1 UDP-N-acetylmuramate dehydrogenase [Mycetocola manganoxydans]GHD52721.1 UDP-N-acetylenolpyruvoylglucosamine reductase [Mycetocola manganoxydans]